MFKKSYKRIKFAINRIRIKIRQKRAKAIENRAKSNMNSEQLEVFNLIISIIEAQPDSIRYNINDNDVYILYSDIIINIKLDGSNICYINNHRGFHQLWFKTDSFDFLIEKIHKKANKAIRKLKNEILNNRKAFINSIKEQTSLN